MLRHGELDGAFTTNSRELSPDEAEVVALAADPEARIEVRSAHPEPVAARPAEQAIESEPVFSEVNS
jgi:hypothetical protein